MAKALVCIVSAIIAAGVLTGCMDMKPLLDSYARGDFQKGWNQEKERYAKERQTIASSTNKIANYTNIIKTDYTFVQTNRFTLSLPVEKKDAGYHWNRN
jgi:hypothetical protein